MREEHPPGGHPAERSIELFVLGSETLSDGDRLELSSHLRDCVGCREIAERMREFYREVWTELERSAGRPPAPTPGNLPAHPARSIGRPASDRPALHAVETGLPFRVARWVTRHPVVAAAGSAAFLGGMAFLLVLGPPRAPSPPADIDPASFRVAGIRIIVENESGDSLGMIRASKRLTSAFTSDPETFGREVRLLDVDADGINEVVWIEREETGNSRRTLIRAEDFSPRATLWSYEFINDLDFAGTDWESARFFLGGIEVVSSAPGEGMLIAALYTSTTSVAQIVFLRAVDGAVAARYVHQGGLSGMTIVDLDADGRSDVLLGGAHNGFDEAVLIVLDPGILASAGGVRSGPGSVPLERADEAAYLRFPPTALARANGRSARNNVAEVQWDGRGGRLRLAIQDGMVEGTGQAEYYVNLDRRLEVKGIERGDGYVLGAKRLVALGRMNEVPDADYFLEYAREIRWLSGGAWRNHPTWNRPGRSPGPSAEHSDP